MRLDDAVVAAALTAEAAAQLPAQGPGKITRAVKIRLDAPPPLRHAHEELTQGSRRRWMTDSNCK